MLGTVWDPRDPGMRCQDHTHNLTAIYLSLCYLPCEADVTIFIPIFPDLETEVQIREVTCPRLHNLVT